MRNEDSVEELLSAWLRVSAKVRNERLVESMTFNEIFICNILYARTVANHEVITATDICIHTRMLKSQVNKVLVAMEKKGLIVRERSSADNRKIIINFTDEGMRLYMLEHEGIRALIESLIERLGEDEARKAEKILTIVADVMEDISRKG